MFSWVMLRESGLQGTGNDWMIKKPGGEYTLFYQKISDEKANIDVLLKVAWLFPYLGSC